MLRRILLAAVLAFTSASLAMAQKTVTGTVTDAESGFPLPGVNIAIQGTFTGTATGLDGTFSIRVNEGDVLVFTFVGYLPQEVTVGTRDVIDISLEEDVALLEEVVVVGYGTQTKADVTGAVGSVDVEAANVGLVQSPEQMIQGRVAGVQVVQSDGDPGAGVTVRIRGGTSIAASNDPLYVIDGVPLDNEATQPAVGNFGEDSANGPRNPLSFLNPSDIESIDILKDASAAAIYGSRGANGVVLITTKKGRAGQLQVDYNGYVASSGLRKKIPLLSASQYRSFVQTNGFSADGLGDATTDWQEAVTQDALSHSHDFAFSGGTEATRYRASVNYLSQDGIIIGSGQERVAGRLNADHKAFNDRLRLGVNMTASYVEDDLTPTTETNGFETALMGNVLKFNPTFPVDAYLRDGQGNILVDEDGNPEYHPACSFSATVGSDFCEVGTSVRNPVAIAEQIDQIAKTTRVLGNTTAEYEIVDGLNAKVNFGLNR
ncbi:MAG: SusC/RagA family TonB-linked outer membrane protein, partial [Rhodothermales bacterium]|nr:SusC/RagA family TonB-linked outer membrane protein [Rhodothermales bacterium]